MPRVGNFVSLEGRFHDSENALSNVYFHSYINKVLGKT